MNMLLKKLLSRYLSPAGDDGTDTGGTETGGEGGAEDRGDDFTPTNDGATDAADQGQADGADGTGTGDGTGADDAGQGSAEGAEGSEDERAQRSPGIPKARFNEVNERKKALETENEQLKRELAEARAAGAAQPSVPAVAQAATTTQPEAAAFDVAAKEHEYATALIEGDTARAAKIRGEINSHLVEQATQQAEGNIARRSAAQLLQDEVKATLSAHSWLDTPEGADALDLIVAARDRAIAQGVAPHLALRGAVSKIAPRFKPVGDGDTPSGVLPGAAKDGDTRSSEAVKRGAADATAQPPVMQVGIGNRATPSARVDVGAMDDEQFAALSPAEKSRLRGD